MKRPLLVLALVPAVLANAGDPVKSRWRSLSTGNLFEVTDYGDRISVRYLSGEFVTDESTEKSDVSVGVNSAREQSKPGRWLLNKRAQGKYVGTANVETSCSYYRQWYMTWATNVCKFADPVELTVTATEITGWRDGQPATKAKFDCAKCQWSKTERGQLQWAREADVAGAPATATAPAPAAAGTAAASTADRGIYTIESTPPSAEVYVDGEFVGSTPMEHSLPAGRHQIELRKKGFTNWSRWLTVAPGTRAKVAAELEH